MYPRQHLRALPFILAFAPIAASIAAEQAIAGNVSGHVVDQNGRGIAQAIVFVEEPAGSSAAAAPVATMDQFNKTFVPGVLPVVVGTQVRFPNRDQIRHHVYSFSRSKRFELPLYKGEQALPVLFDKAGVVTIGCNIHDWMSAVILVLPNTHYAVTDESGAFTLSGLQPGTHTLVAWHARSRQKTQDAAQRVDVAVNDLDLTFKLSLAPARSRPATRGSRWDQ